MTGILEKIYCAKSKEWLRKLTRISRGFSFVDSIFLLLIFILKNTCRNILLCRLMMSLFAEVPEVIENYYFCVVKNKRLDSNVISPAKRMKLIMQYGVSVEGHCHSTCPFAINLELFLLVVYISDFSILV